MPHFCSKSSNGSSAHLESKPKSLQGLTVLYVVYTIHSPLPPLLPALVSLLLIEHTKHALASGPLHFISPGCKGCSFPSVRFLLNVTLLERFSLITPPPQHSLPPLPYFIFSYYVHNCTILNILYCPAPAP